MEEEPTAANAASIAFEWLPKRDSRVDPNPASVRLFEVDVSVSGECKFDYTRCAEFAVADQAAFEQKMSALIQGGGDIGKPPTRQKVNGKYLGNRMAIAWGDPDAAASVSYLVFRLSDKVDWSFSFDPTLAVPGFSMRTGQMGNRIFSRGGKFSPNGQHFPADSSDTALAECRFAYFVVNGPKLPDPGTKDYSRKFNMHVDLLERDAGIISARTPIIIDPDVRNPGGTGT